jgi:hypothetical protein
VVVATTRQMPGVAESTVADSMFVSGNETDVRLSHDRTGVALAMSGFGCACISGGGGGPPARWAWPTATRAAITDTEMTVDFMARV